MNTMTSDLAKNLGLAHKVFRQGELVGITPSQWNALAENPTLFDALHDVMLGRAEIKPIEHVIDCDKDPFVPSSWGKVEEHQKGGQLKWNVAQVQFWLAEGQQNDKMIEGNKLRKELVGKLVLNANVLDYLLANPHLIPEEWKGKSIGFWGTIYRNTFDDLCIRCLYWNGTRVRWDWYYHCLDNDWYYLNTAALRAS